MLNISEYDLLLKLKQANDDAIKLTKVPWYRRINTIKLAETQGRINMIWDILSMCPGWQKRLLDSGKWNDIFGR